ncbi:MAG: YlxM family DNA-binding protein [Lentihominibacter sp.]|nr:YlxM family DNA-binding protein [Clostridiales bacterium]MDY2680013.1 YlxM family DNA-binding protein [Lentihominibacter sp.]
MKIDEITQASLLYDFYGQLLSKRQKEVMELYHEENLSLSEIAAEFDISRQGVHDALKNAEKSLKSYEEKLGLVAKFQKSSEAVKEIDGIIDNVIGRLQERHQAGAAEAVNELKKVKLIIDKLED